MERKAYTTLLASPWMRTHTSRVMAPTSRPPHARRSTTSICVRVQREAAHPAKKEDYRLFAAANRETSKFILAVVEDTWVRKLRDPDLFYTAVKPQDLINHLQAMCVGLHATGVLNIQN